MTKELLQQALDALIESRDDVNTCLYQHKPFAGRARYDMRIAFYEQQLVKHDAAIEGLKQAQTLAQLERSYPVAEYEDGQWWVKELESLFVAPIGSGVTADQKRAADIALNFMRTVWAQQEQPASVDAYVGAREDAAIWKKRALEAEELNRKFIAELNGPTYLGEPAQQEQPSKTERQIRRMFCVTYASDSSPYMDDGEAQDNSMFPCIDFLRDSPEQIQSKMVERAIAKHKAQQEQPAQEPVAYCVSGQVTNWARDFSKYKTQHYTRPVYTHPAPTQPALSDASIDAAIEAWFTTEIGGVKGHPFRNRMKAAIEAHCRGGAVK